MMIYLNGKKEEVADGMSLGRLLEVRKIRPEVVTVELNDTLIDREHYASTLLAAGDRLEFVYYMGGGF